MEQDAYVHVFVYLNVPIQYTYQNARCGRYSESDQLMMSAFVFVVCVCMCVCVCVCTNAKDPILFGDEKAKQKRLTIRICVLVRGGSQKHTSCVLACSQLHQC